MIWRVRQEEIARSAVGSFQGCGVFISLAFDFSDSLPGLRDWKSQSVKLHADHE